MLYGLVKKMRVIKSFAKQNSAFYLPDKKISVIPAVYLLKTALFFACIYYGRNLRGPSFKTVPYLFLEKMQMIICFNSCIHDRASSRSVHVRPMQPENS